MIRRTFAFAAMVAMGLCATAGIARAATAAPAGLPLKGPVVVSGAVPPPAPGVAASAVAPAPSVADTRPIVLVSEGADPELVATLRRALEQVGATVVIVPVAGVPNGLALASANSAARAPGASLAAAPAAGPVVVWDGQLRFRYETRTLLDYRLPGTFGRAATQSLGERGDVSLMRTRVGANVRLAPGVRGYFNLQDARMMGAEGSPGGTLANVDLYNAWVDLDSLGGAPVTARIGRQVLAYGEGRILTGSDWSNAGRGYDGARLRWTPGRSQADGFVTWINEGRLSGNDRLLMGVDLLWRRSRTFDAEGYHFERAFGDMSYVSEGGRAGGLFDGTSGLRARAVAGPFELRAEGAVQRGRRAGDEVRAAFGVARLTADLHSAWRTRVSLEHMRASGDPSPGDGRFQRFDPVYWGGHNFQGAIDVVAEANAQDWCAGLATQPAAAWSVQSEVHSFSLANARDAWVDAAGTVLRRDVTGAAGTRLGQELDVTVRWEARPKVSVLGGASRFYAGPFVHATGGGEDETWGFLQLAVGF